MFINTSLRGTKQSPHTLINVSNLVRTTPPQAIPANPIAGSRRPVDVEKHEVVYIDYQQLEFTSL